MVNSMSAIPYESPNKPVAARAGSDPANFSSDTSPAHSIPAPILSPALESKEYFEDEENRPRPNLPRRVWDSFQRDPNAHATPVGTLGANGKVFDLEGAAHATANTTLARKLKGRHLQMIAIGGSIGMGTHHQSSSLMTDFFRHRSVRRIRQGSGKRRPSSTTNWL